MPCPATTRVPFAVLIALWAMDRRAAADARRIPELTSPPVRDRRLIGLAGMAFLLGSTSPYYAIMSALLVVSAGLIGTLRTRRWRRLASGWSWRPQSEVVFIANLVPEILHRLENGANPEVARRSVAESDAYGLRLSHMLLPDPEHRLSLFETIGERAHDVFIPGEGGAYLGVMGIGGLLLGVFAAFGWALDAATERRSYAALVNS